MVLQGFVSYCYSLQVFVSYCCFYRFLYLTVVVFFYSFYICILLLFFTGEENDEGDISVSQILNALSTDHGSVLHLATQVRIEYCLGVFPGHLQSLQGPVLGFRVWVAVLASKYRL